MVELLVVVTIAAMLVGIAAPGMMDLVKSARLTSATNDLFASLLIARSEAAKCGMRVALCKSGDSTTCANNGGWEQGWIVFRDVDNSGTRGPGEEVILRAQPLSESLRLGGNLNVARYVSYTSTGETRLVGGGFQAGTITLCNASDEQSEGRQIIVSSSGRPRVQRTVLASCP